METNKSLLPQIKPSAAITDSELAEMHAIYKLVDPNMPEQHILHDHIERSHPLFYLFREKGRIMAFQAFSLFIEQTPFHKRPIPVMQINLSYKHPDAPAHFRHFAKTSTFHFLARSFGPLWFLKQRFASVQRTYNPRVLNRIGKSFPVAWPRAGKSVPEPVTAFLQQFYTEKLHYAPDMIDHNLVWHNSYSSPTNITEKWDRDFRSRQEAPNHYCLEHDIVRQDQGEYYLTGKSVISVGYYSPFSRIRERIQSRRLGSSFPSGSSKIRINPNLSTP